MIRTVLAAAALLWLSLPAEARQRPIAHQRYAPECNVSMPCEGVGKPVVSAKEAHRRARGQALYHAMPFGMPTRSAGEGARFIRGRLVCAVNVGAELARRGIRGTGSARAKSYLSWGRASRPVPGAVAVFNRGKRGGHVAIVHHVRPDGTVIYLNPSSRRQAWQVGPYRKRPIAYRVAGF
ncbi:hypothetical protein AFEL58S_02028 [Afipia felis]